MLFCDGLARIGGVKHGFFTREGGVSEGIYASLNCGPGSRDRPDAVRENRRRVAEMLGRPPEALVTLRQVHGKNVAVIEETTAGDTLPEADALVTRVPGVILGILTADCAPVLFCDPRAGVIGAAHAGWKGALGGVLEATLTAMELLGASRGHIVTAVGPCIGQLSYEVGPDFLLPFLAESGENERFFSDADRGEEPRKRCFDLRGYVAQKLVMSGIVELHLLGNDTCAEEDTFFSYRRATLRGEPDYGRQVSCILLEK